MSVSPEPGQPPDSLCAPAEAGFALVIVLLCLVVLTAVSVLAFHAARGQLVASRVGVEVRRATLAAESAVASGLQLTGENPLVSGVTPVVLGSGSLGETEWELSARSIATELVLLHGRGVVPPTGTAQQAGRVVWWPKVGSRVMAHRAAVEAPQLILDGSGVVEVADVLGARPGIPACSSEPDLDVSLSGLPTLAGPPNPPEWGSEPDLLQFSGPRFGWLWSAEIGRRARRTLGTTFVGGDCPGCWSGLSHASGNLRLSGSGSGVLFVEGTVVLETGAQWTGLVLAGEAVVLNDAARVTGFVRAGGAVQLTGSSSIDGSACAVYQALRATPELFSPVPLPTRSWIAMY